MCIVEVEGRRGFVPSCITKVEEGMVVKTNTPEINEARRIILDLILSSHNRECLTCTRNGNCELQTLAQKFGITDLEFEGDKVAKSIIGIGLNVNNPIAKEIEDIAISCKQVLNKELNLESVLATLCFNLYQQADYLEYKKHLLYLGEEVTITDEKSTYKAIIEDILPDGRLKLNDGRVFSSAEITLRK